MSLLQQANHYKLINALIIAAVSSVLIIPIRGGLQLAPINQSSVYFSNNNFANHATVNATWNFLHGLMNKTSATHNPYNFLPAQQVKAVVDSLYTRSEKFEKVLNTDSPNVILIIWESFTEKATHISIGGKEITPYFNALKKEGIYFSNVYASGDRTDKGLAAILSGYPALQATSILRSVSKSAKLPSIGKMLKAKGYATSFYYGGETAFANMKSYILNGGFDQVIEKDDFAAKDQNSKWGTHDGVVAQKLSRDLGKRSQPFFATWLTLSSHEPYEIPVQTSFRGNEFTTKFLASLNYTDNVMNEFILNAKKQAWWDNTVIIIIADHGHPLPATESKEHNFKIPMLWVGGAVINTGIVENKLVSQTDLAATLGSQLGTDTNFFPLSRNIFDTATKQWAFFTYNNGFGFLQPDKKLVFDNIGKALIEQRGIILPKDTEAGKSLQQFYYQNYLDK
jgi:phosphoglycerol transferase MdoB-like AlkP superfamily enzyme